MTKKRKLNSKNPKYRTQAEVKATTKEVDKRVLITEGKNFKAYATFYKQQGEGGNVVSFRVETYKTYKCPTLLQIKYEH